MIRVNLGSIESLRRAEKQKRKLENAGYNQIDTKMDGIEKAILIYKK